MEIAQAIRTDSHLPAWSPAEFEALLQRERGIWLPLIRDLKITLD